MKSAFNKFKIWLSSDASSKYGLKTLLILLIMSCLLCACIMVLTIPSFNVLRMLLLIVDLRVFLLNVLPVFLLMAFLYCIFNRMWVSYAIVSVISFVVAEVNRLKISFRDDPFVFEDILFFSEAGEMAGNYKLYLDIVSVVMLGLIIYFGVKVYKRTGCISSKIPMRLIGLVCSAVVMFFSFNHLYFHNTKLHNSLWRPVYGSEYKAADQSSSRGVIYSFIKSIPDAFAAEPANYDPQNASIALNQYEDVPLEEDKKVHIISIMLEAYNDFTKFKNIKFNVDPYKNFHRLQRDSYSGELYTDIFAGSTIFTERQFITGYNNMRFPLKDTQSYVRYFNDQGYRTEAMHPGYGWFYNRNNINKFLGFDEFYYFENKFGLIPDEELEDNRYWEYISDWDFFDYIIKGYEDAVSKNQKYFNFSVTIQNHGPYLETPDTHTEYLVRKDSYSEAGYNIINNYLFWINKTDIALKKLRDYVDGQEEPIVMILFGDHNPWMGNNDWVYEMLEINFDHDTPEGAANYYETPYVIYANYAAKTALGKRFRGKGPTISPMFLMNEFFDYANLEGPQYLNYLTDLKNKHKVINKVYTEQKGKFIPTDEMGEDECISQLRSVEYFVKNRKFDE